MHIEIEYTGQIQKLNDSVQKCLENNAKSLLVLACDENRFDRHSLDSLLKHIPIPVIGGIFPAILYQDKKLEKGTIILGFTEELKLITIKDLSNISTDVEGVIEGHLQDIDAPRTIFVLVDGFSKRIRSLIDALFNIFGLETNYIGGGAGSLKMRQKPCLFTNDGFFYDSAILAISKIQSGIGVSHGWKSIDGPFKVTESKQNTIFSLDWKPAYKVYRQVVESKTAKRFSDVEFFELAKAYPFGVAKLGAERIVRDPIKIGDHDSIVCVGDIPENAFIDILNGNQSSLIEAARMAYCQSQKNYTFNSGNRLTFFIDCISRVLFLGPDFDQELKMVYNNKHPLVGVCSIGEIANNGKSYLEFYNKTAVVASLAY